MSTITRARRSDIFRKILKPGGPLLAITGLTILGVVGQGLAAVPASATPARIATPTSSTATASDFAPTTSDASLAVDGEGAADGYHVRIASQSSGYAWRDIAILKPAALDPSTWYGYQCLTGDGKHVAVAVLPGDAINSNVERDRGAYAYSVDVASGKVHALASGVGLKYHSPGCDATDDATFTANLGSDESSTEALSFNLATSTKTADTVVSGQVTSVVTAGGQLVGARGSDLVRLPAHGTSSKPAKPVRAASAGGLAYDLRVGSNGSVQFLARSTTTRSALIREWTRGGVKTLGRGPSSSTRLFEGSHGADFVTGAQKVAGDIRSVSSSALPLGGTVASLDANAVFGAKATSRRSVKANSAISTQAEAADQAALPQVESTQTGKVFTADNAQVTPALSTDTAVDEASGAETNAARSGLKKPNSQPAPNQNPAKLTAYTRTGQGSLNINDTLATTAGAATPALSPNATTPKCSVPRLQPTLEAMQPSNAQVDWATQMAEQGLLTGSQYTRPANFENMGLVAYAPSTDFPPVALLHPSSDTWNTVPRSVMLAIESQESNFNQASWHALPGIAGDPLIADYYGSAGTIDTIDYPNADCGYGVSQVTTGMAAADTSISLHGEEKIAADYEENVAAGLNILQKTWNQLYTSGITANGGDPKYLENWYMAAWAYNTGIQPNASFGNTSGCTPSATCAGPDGTWGLGWSNNPQNPDYDPTRLPYLKSSYADAAHPSSWPYQERIMGWMASPILRYGFTAYNPPTYNGGQTWLQIPNPSLFCDSSSDCNPAAAGKAYCSLSDSECWWHKPVTWISTCSTTCATSSYEDASGSTLPTYTAKYQPTCNQDTSAVPAGSIIVDDLATPSQNDEGCSGMNWSNGGTFTYTPGTNSSGDPVGNIDTHQLGSGFGGHILFTHTEPASSTNLINKGTWTPTLPSRQYYDIMIHLPATGATTSDVTYQVNPGGGGALTNVRVNQNWKAETWATIGRFGMQNGGSVTLTNASTQAAGSEDVAYDAIAFVPKGGNPGVPIGGPPTFQDEPAGSNPALVNCLCHTRSAGDPVDTNTGAFTQSATDLATPGLGEALSLSRTYTSSLADPAGPAGSTGAVNGVFGPGWTYSYGLSSSMDSNGNVTIHQEDGSQVAFTDSSGVYTPLGRYDATLTSSGGNYYYTRHGSEQFVFATSTGRLTSESDQAGRAANPTYATALNYNAAGALTTITDPEGRTITLSWTGTHITKAVNSGGQEVDYGYNPAGDLTDVDGVGTTRTGGANGDQDHSQYAYTAVGLMSSMRTPANYGKTTTPTPATAMVYDASERVTTQTDPMGNATTFVYGPNTANSLVSGQTLITDPAGHETLDTYTNGLLSSETKGYGSANAETWSYQYDPLSLGVSQQTNPDGSVQTFSYDSAGHQVSASNALGQTTSAQYDAAGHVTQSVNPNGIETATTYNAAGAPTSVVVSQSGQSADSANDNLDPTYTRQATYAYSNAARPTQATTSTDAKGNATTYTYDSFGNVATKTDAASNVTDYGYNTSLGELTTEVLPAGTAAGHTASCTPPAKGCETFTYDAYGHITKTTDPLGHTTTAAFDADGNQLTAVDGNSHTTATTFDSDDRPILVTQPNGSATATTYNGDGTIAKSTDPNGNVTSYTYNSLGEKITSTNPDSKVTSFTYDSLGNLAQETTPDNETTTNTWNSADQLTHVSYSGTATPAVSYTYDSDGNRLTMVDGTGTTSYSYDAFDEESSTTNGSGGTVGYGYDADGQVTTIVYPGTGNTVTDTYNNLEQLSGVTDPAGKSTTFAYNADGAPTTTTAGNGTVTTVQHDNADQSISSTLTLGSTTLGSISYTRNGVGDLTGTTPTSGAPGAATTYSYSANEQLTGSTAGSTTTGYTYDAAGDPTRLGTSTQVFDAAGELCWSTTTTVTSPTCGAPASGATKYVDNGDGQRTTQTPATGTATNYAYNAAGELTSIAGATTATYTYNGDGLRTAKTVGSTTTNFTYSTLSSVARLLSDGNNYYIYGPTGTPVEQFTSGGANPLYYFSDAHGSTVELTNSSGAVAGTYAYSAWGAVTAHSGTASTPIEFAGAYADSETGFLYLQARYYDAATALFITVDPLTAATLETYEYAGDNPLNLSDPLGLFKWTFGLAAGLVSTGFGVAGLVLDATGVAAPLGAVFEGVSLVSGGAAAAYGCGTGDKVSCGLDLAGLATGGIGGIARVSKAVFSVSEVAKDGLEAASAGGGAFSTVLAIAGSIVGVGNASGERDGESGQAANVSSASGGSMNGREC